MARDTAGPIFMGLPLEVRHAIFEHVSERGTEPKKLLRYWFERREAKELVAQAVADNPNGPAPRVVYYDDHYDDESSLSEEHEDDDNEDVEDETIEPFDSEDEHEIELFYEGDEYHGTDELEELEEDTETHLSSEETEDVQDDSEEVHSDDDQDDANESEHAADGNADTTTSTALPPPPTPVVRPQSKWRHIPKFMRLTHCPPPLELLLTSRQLNNEAKNWFYDVAVLRINATGSFAHTSFFEEAFRQITDAACSPMENIRKVQLTFAWDTTWIRADTSGWVDAIFSALLGQRASVIHQILLQAPHLRQVLIHWHDSAQDNESASLMLDTLELFHTLPARVKVEEHYIAADTKPKKHTVAGKRRVEFQNILDMGVERLL